MPSIGLEQFRVMVMKAVDGLAARRSYQDKKEFLGWVKVSLMTNYASTPETFEISMRSFEDIKQEIPLGLIEGSDYPQEMVESLVNRLLIRFQETLFKDGYFAWYLGGHL